MIICVSVELIKIFCWGLYYASFAERPNEFHVIA